MKVIRNALIFSLILGIPAFARADSQWVLKQSTLIYHVSHPLHHVEGVSHSARGKGECKDGTCSFLAAVPVKSFDSGDTNRDLHMLEVTRGAQFPLVIVRTEFSQGDLKTGTPRVNLTVQFAGQTAHYDQIPFHLVRSGGEIRVVGTIPTKVSDFKIKPPELLAMPIKDDIPVSVDMTWDKAQ
jgi:YceI-like domain